MAIRHNDRVSIRFSVNGVRLDQALAFEAQISRSKAQEWIEAGIVLVDGKPHTKASYKLRGETVEAVPPAAKPHHVQAEDIALEVLYEDTDLVVVNKPAGMITHPAPGVFSGTLVNAIMGRYNLSPEAEEGRPELVRPGIVHRLDKDTSGVMVVARHEAAHSRLSEAFAGRKVFKEYLALTEGQPKEGILAAPIGRHPVDRIRMHVGGVAARYAETDFSVLEKTPHNALVSAILHTGRTHQIRVHLKHLGTPVVGDAIYGKTSEHIARQALHAHQLRFQHPRTGKYVEFVAPMPKDMHEAWEKLKSL
jgi:23S rRNA pseudouridine1911/1915/1917 synthase